MNWKQNARVCIILNQDGRSGDGLSFDIMVMEILACLTLKQNLKIFSIFCENSAENKAKSENRHR